MTTKTTNHLSMSRPAFAIARLRAWLRTHDTILLIAPCIATLLIAALLATTIYRSMAAPAAAQPTPALPIILIATAPPVVPPTPAAQVAQLPPPFDRTRRAIIVYGAPDLTTAIGAVEIGRSYTLLARYGADWLQVQMDGGTGVVFVRTSDVIGADLADIAPPPSPAVVYVAAPAYQQPAAQPLEAVSTPEQQQYQAASAPAAPPQYQAIADRQQWAMDVQKAWVRRQLLDEDCIGPCQ